MGKYRSVSGPPSHPGLVASAGLGEAADRPGCSALHAAGDLERLRGSEREMLFPAIFSRQLSRLPVYSEQGPTHHQREDIESKNAILFKLN